MGTKLKPGRFDCYAAAAEDEPLFVLLARDPDAPHNVRRWAKRRIRRLVREHALGKAVNVARTVSKVVEALACAQEMEVWRESRRK